MIAVSPMRRPPAADQVWFTTPKNRRTGIAYRDLQGYTQIIEVSTTAAVGSVVRVKAQ